MNLMSLLWTFISGLDLGGATIVWYACCVAFAIDFTLQQWVMKKALAACEYSYLFWPKALRLYTRITHMDFPSYTKQWE